MKIITLLMPLLAFTFALSAQVIPYQELSPPATKAGTDLYVYYSTPSDEVIIKDGKVSHRSKINPSGRDEEVGRQTVAESVPLNGRQLSSLKEQVSSSGFFRASPTPYQSSANFELLIRTSQQEQHLAYDQDPAYGRSHPSFDQIANLLWRIVTEVEQ